MCCLSSQLLPLGLDSVRELQDILLLLREDVDVSEAEHAEARRKYTVMMSVHACTRGDVSVPQLSGSDPVYASNLCVVIGDKLRAVQGMLGDAAFAVCACVATCVPRDYHVAGDDGERRSGPCQSDIHALRHLTQHSYGVACDTVECEPRHCHACMHVMRGSCGSGDVLIGKMPFPSHKTSR